MTPEQAPLADEDCKMWFNFAMHDRHFNKRA